MNLKMKTVFATSAAIIGLALPLSTGEARGYNSHQAPETSTDTFGRCGVNYGRGYRGDYGYDHGRRYHGRQYHGSVRTRCRPIHTCYINRGCHRYKKITYLHERINGYGHVMSCWKTYKTFRIGRY